MDDARTDGPMPARFSYRETVTILVGLMLGMFLAALDQTIIATALPRLAADLHGVEHLSWVVSAYLLTSTAATPIYGKLSDFYGRKVMLQIAIAIFLVTSVLCAMAATMGQLILFRGLQGLGGGGLIAMAHATIADVISPRERGRYQAYIASTFAAASVFGPVLGGLFVDYLSWRWVFWINLPLAIGALVVSEATLKRLVVKRLRHRIDYPGAVLVVATICCVLLVTTMGGNDLPWDSPLIEILGVAAIVLLVLCVLQEFRASEPILPPRLFADRVFLAVSVTNVLTALGMLGGIIFMPLFMQLVFSLQAGNSGLMLIPLTAASVTGAIATGRLIASTGRYKIFPLVGTGLMTVAMLLLSRVDGTTPLAAAAGAMALYGFGTGLVGPVLLVAVQNAVESRDLGTATASISFFRSLGGAFGVALFSAILIARLNTLVGAIPGHEAIGGEPGVALLHAGAAALDLAPLALRPAVTAAVTSAFEDVFRVAAVIAAVTFLCAALLKEVPLRTTVAGEREKEAVSQGLEP